MNNNAFLADGCVSLLVTYLLHSTLIIAVVWSGLRCMRVRSPIVCERMWKLAMVMALVTSPLQLGLGYGRIVEVDWSTIVSTLDVSETTATHRDDDRVASVTMLQDDDESPLANFTPIVIETLGSEEANVSDAVAASHDDERGAITSPPNTGRHWAIALVAVAGVWWLLCSVRLASMSRSLQRRLAGARELRECRARTCLTHLQQHAGISRSVRLLESDDFDEPVACGWRQWSIVLPTGTVERLDRQELNALLSHELAHLVRGDQWWQAIGFVLCSCLPLQPLHFVARRRWQQAAEQLCDDWAVRHGADNVALARCLTEIVEWKLNGRAREPLAVGAASPPIVVRVERLLSSSHQRDRWTSPWHRRCLTIGCLVLATMAAAALPSVVMSRDDTIDLALDVSPFATLPTEAHATPTLDEELRQLTDEMHIVAQLVAASHDDPEVQEIAERLRRHTEALTERIRRLSHD